MVSRLPCPPRRLGWRKLIGLRPRGAEGGARIRPQAGLGKEAAEVEEGRGLGRAKEEPRPAESSSQSRRSGKRRMKR